jgi:hypothetical protein
MQGKMIVKLTRHDFIGGLNNQIYLGLGELTQVAIGQGRCFLSKAIACTTSRGILSRPMEK